MIMQRMLRFSVFVLFVVAIGGYVLGLGVSLAEEDCPDGEPEFVLYLSAAGYFDCRCYDENTRPRKVPESSTLLLPTSPLWEHCPKTWEDVFRKVVNDWAGTWEPAVAPSRTITTYDGTGPPPPSEMYYVDIVCGAGGILGEASGGITGIELDESTGEITGSWIYMNGFSVCWTCDEDCFEAEGCDAESCPDGLPLPFSVWDVAAHEYGHALGFCHPEPDQLCENIMDVLVSQLGDCTEAEIAVPCRDFGPSDRAAVQWAYGSGRPSASFGITVEEHGGNLGVTIQKKASGRYERELRLTAIDIKTGLDEELAVLSDPWGADERTRSVALDRKLTGPTVFRLMARFGGRWLDVVDTYHPGSIAGSVLQNDPRSGGK